MFLRNAGKLLPDYIKLLLKGHSHSCRCESLKSRSDMCIYIYIYIYIFFFFFELHLFPNLPLCRFEASFKGGYTLVTGTGVA